MHELNEEQRRAVEHGPGPLLIIAGAGTGKTRVITHRIAHLIREGVEPARILALTFTEKAAAEMEERVDTLVPYGFSNVFISTFHSFGDRVIRDNALAIGLPPDFKLLNESECIIFLKEHLFELPMDYYRPKGDPTRYLSALVRFMGRLKDEDVSPAEFLDHVEGLKKRGPEGADKAAFAETLREREELALTYSKYRELMEANGFLDHGDQITLALRLFRTRPNILERYREKFLYILTDEFQDTNYAQFELLKLLAGERKNITVVADDDQSIYKFRGAAVSNVLGFLKTFPECRPVTLKMNYRSIQPILDSAYRLITHNNPERLEVRSGIDKRLVSAVKPGKKKGREAGVSHMRFESLPQEAEFVADAISREVKSGEAVFRDYAVLVRARSDAVPFLSALDSKGIPYHFSGNSGLYSREEITLIISFLKAITDFSDNLSVFNLASSPVYGLNAKDLVPCNVVARRRCAPLYYVMKEAAEGRLKEAAVSEEGLEAIKRLVYDLERFSERALKERAGRVLYAFLTESGYIGGLVKDRSEENDDRVRNIARFFENITRMEETLSINKTSALVEHLKLLIEAGENPGLAEPDPESDAVQVLTVHKAKGLEFPTVFMVGLVNERFPRRSRKELIELPEELIKELLPTGDVHLQEERRLFYVGMTRARERLMLTSAADYGGVRSKKPSPFVLEALDSPKAEVIKADSLKVIENLGAGPAEAKGERAPSENEVLHLNSYKIDDYLTCPLKYRFIHVLGIPLLPHHTIMYGKAVHDAISYYFRRRLEGETPPPLEEFLNVFRASWSSAGFLTKRHETERFDSGMEALKRFYAQAATIVPKAVEKDFTVTRQGYVFRGRWDLIVERPAGPCIVDFKTSEIRDQKKADKRTKTSTQLLLYSLAFKEAFGKEPALCELHFVESGLVGSAHFKEKDLDKAASIMEEVAEGVRRRDFTARPDYLNCGYCAYNNICTEKVKG